MFSGCKRIRTNACCETRGVIGPRISCLDGHAVGSPDVLRQWCRQVAPLGVAAAAGAPAALEAGASLGAAAAADGEAELGAGGMAASGAQASSSTQAVRGAGQGPGFGPAEGAGGRVLSGPQAGGSSQAVHGAGRGTGSRAAEHVDAARPELEASSHDRVWRNGGEEGGVGEDAEQPLLHAQGKWPCYVRRQICSEVLLPCLAMAGKVPWIEKACHCLLLPPA